MSRVVSLNDLICAGVDLSADEAVAIVQQLVAREACDIASEEPESRPVLPEHVVLNGDGTVSVRDGVALRSEREIAVFIDHLLQRTEKVSGRLRWTLARAAGAVDAPSFGSAAALSEALTRFESGERHAVVRGLLQRRPVSSPRPTAATTSVPSESHHRHERRSGPSQSQLRRQLRDADRQRYDLQQRLVNVQAAAARARRMGQAGIAALAVLAFGIAGWFSTSHHLLERVAGAAVARGSLVESQQRRVDPETRASSVATPVRPTSPPDLPAAPPGSESVAP